MPPRWWRGGTHGDGVAWEKFDAQVSTVVGWLCEVLMRAACRGAFVLRAGMKDGVLGIGARDLLVFVGHGVCLTGGVGFG